MRFDQLIYDASPGEHIGDACWKCIQHGLGGICFNGVVTRRQDGDTETAMAHRHREAAIGDAKNVRCRPAADRGPR